MADGAVAASGRARTQREVQAWVRWCSGMADLQVRCSLAGAVSWAGPVWVDVRSGVVTIDLAAAGAADGGVDVLSPAGRMADPVVAGVGVHAAARAWASRWAGPVVLGWAPEVAVAAAVLESVRAEHQHLLVRPQDRPLLQAAALAVALPEPGVGEAARRWWASAMLTLSAGRVDSGVLASADVSELVESLERIVGRECAEGLRRVWVQMLGVGDADVDRVQALASHWVRIALPAVVVETTEGSGGLLSELGEDEDDDDEGEGGGLVEEVDVSAGQGCDDGEQGDGRDEDAVGDDASVTEPAPGDDRERDGQERADSEDHAGGEVDGDRAHDGEADREDMAEDTEPGDGQTHRVTGQKEGDGDTEDEGTPADPGDTGTGGAGGSKGEDEPAPSDTAGPEGPEAGGDAPLEAGSDPIAEALDALNAAIEQSMQSARDELATHDEHLIDDAAADAGASSGQDDPDAPSTATGGSTLAPPAPAPPPQLRTREPTPQERLLAAQIGRTLAQAPFEDQRLVLARSASPPGRLDGREALLRSAQEALGLPVTAQPFRRHVRRRHVRPPLSVGLMFDASSSMHWSTRLQASTAWALAHAVHQVKGRCASVVYDSDVWPLATVGQPPARVTTYECGGTMENFIDAFTYLDRSVQLMSSRGVRLLVVVSDGIYHLEQGGFAHRVIPQFVARGGIVLWATGPGQAFVPDGAQRIILDHDAPLDCQACAPSLACPTHRNELPPELLKLPASIAVALQEALRR